MRCGCGGFGCSECFGTGVFPGESYQARRQREANERAQREFEAEMRRKRERKERERKATLARQNQNEKKLTPISTQKKTHEDASGAVFLFLLVPLIALGCAGLVVGYFLFFADMALHRILYNAHVRQERHYLDRHKAVQPEKRFLGSLQAKGRAFLHLGIGIGGASLFFAKVQASLPPWSGYHMEPFQAWLPYGVAGAVIGVAFTVRRSLIAYHQHLRKTGEIS